MASDTLAPSKTREKVALKPGFHLIDWMNLMKRADVSGRKGAPLRRISMKEVREHKSRYDCWTVYNKKVYNITNYMDYHPGNCFFASLAHMRMFTSIHFTFLHIDSNLRRRSAKAYAWSRKRLYRYIQQIPRVGKLRSDFVEVFGGLFDRGRRDDRRR